MQTRALDTAVLPRAAGPEQLLPSLHVVGVVQSVVSAGRVRPLFREAQPQLLVVLVQPDDAVATAITVAMAASGHEAVRVAAASWAIALVRREPPDVVVLERSSAGYERLLDEVDDLDVHVPVLVTTFGDAPRTGRCLDASQATALVRRVEDVAWGR